MTMTRRKIPAIVAVGGFDPSGGAGVLVDTRAAGSQGVHAAAVITLDTVQDGRCFHGAKVREPRDVGDVLRCMMERFSPEVVKVGAIGNAEIAEVLLEILEESADVAMVIDPVLASTTGGGLIDEDGERVLREKLLVMAAVITPNTAEAARLVGGAVGTREEMREAASSLVDMGAGAALVKGGHLSGETVADVLCIREGGTKRLVVFERPRLDVGEVRGTGCALSSLIAAGLAKGEGLEAACRGAGDRLALALERSAVCGWGPGFLVF